MRNWQKRIFEMIGLKAIHKCKVKPELVDVSTFRLGRYCSGTDDNEDENEEAVKAPVPMDEDDDA